MESIGADEGKETGGNIRDLQNQNEPDRYGCVTTGEARPRLDKHWHCGHERQRVDLTPSVRSLALAATV
jgi:hypothetical protein